MRCLLISCSSTAVLGLALALMGCSDDGDAAPADAGQVEAALPDAPGQPDAGRDLAALDTLAPDGAQLTLLTNENPCKLSTGSVAPDPGEEGHLVAARLTPKAYPFVVSNLRYVLSPGSSKCDNAIAHRVELYVSAKPAPDVTPTSVGTLQVPAAKPMAGLQRQVALSLPQALNLKQGEHLFVAVALDQHATSKKVLCLEACKGAGVKDRNYWSGAAKAPYKWTTLSSFGLDVNARIEALGN